MKMLYILPTDRHIFVAYLLQYGILCHLETGGSNMLTPLAAHESVKQDKVRGVRYKPVTIYGDRKLMLKLF